MTAPAAVRPRAARSRFLAILTYTLQSCFPRKRWAALLLPCLGAVLFGLDKFVITSISATGSDVAMAWPVFGGNHYRVQAANSLTDTFLDITADIVPPSNSGLGVTNYLDVGGLTNSANRFYRVRQIYSAMAPQYGAFSMRLFHCR